MQSKPLIDVATSYQFYLFEKKTEKLVNRIKIQKISVQCGT